MNDKRVLLIAGSDSSGGAGLEADQKVTAAHGCYAMTATTALTIQNTQGVHGIHVTPPEFVADQIAACVNDIGVDAIKTGMLASKDTISAIVRTIKKLGPSAPLIVDPVMASTSGSQLLPDEAIDVLRNELLPITTVLTPNIPEANLLVGLPKESRPSNQEGIIQLAKSIHRLGPRYVLIKGGHLAESQEGKQKESIVDILYDGQVVVTIAKPLINSRNTHGTGCSLASAIACNTALGHGVPQAVKLACHYVEAGIKLSVDRGQGPGPINHFHSVYTLPFAPGRFVEYLISRPDVSPLWRGYTEHAFVQQLQSGSLEISKFRDYLVQDYLFLTEFARAKALSASKVRFIEGIVDEAEVMLHIHREMKLHLTYCQSFGLTKEEMEETLPAQACLAYTSYLHDVGHSEDWFAMQVAFAPCLLGYGMIARRLHASEETVRGTANPYWQWIENYVAEDYSQAVDKGRETLEAFAVKQSPNRIEELVKVFQRAVLLETAFWGMGNAGADAARERSVQCL